MRRPNPTSGSFVSRSMRRRSKLRYFVVLAEEHLHFSRAAARLRVAQPALSQQVKALEGEIGATLIDRRRGRGACALTPIGKLVFEEAAVLLAQAEAAQQRIEAAVRGRSGRLRLAYTRSARGGGVDTLIARLRAENPCVEVVVESTARSRPVQPMRS